jgi:His/Glu/Gln/Arg/opine family amino acid ABC transporter permease subunit
MWEQINYFLINVLDLRLLPVVKNLGFLLEGIHVTNIVTAGAFSISCVVGLLLALARMSNNKALSMLAAAYIHVFRSMPLLVSIFGIYYCLSAFVKIPSLTAGIAALSLSCTCYMAENFRSGLQSVRRGQIEAANSIGLSPFYRFIKIVFPQSIRVTLPLAINLLAGMLRWSSLVSVIGVNELVHRTEYMVSQYYLPVEFFTTIAIYYVAVSTFLSQMAARLEAKWRRQYATD